MSFRPGGATGTRLYKHVFVTLVIYQNAHSFELTLGFLAASLDPFKWRVQLSSTLLLAFNISFKRDPFEGKPSFGSARTIPTESQLVEAIAVR